MCTALCTIRKVYPIEYNEWIKCNKKCIKGNKVCLYHYHSSEELLSGDCFFHSMIDLWTLDLTSFEYSVSVDYLREKIVLSFNYSRPQKFSCLRDNEIFWSNNQQQRIHPEFFLKGDRNEFPIMFEYDMNDNSLFSRTNKNNLFNRIKKSLSDTNIFCDDMEDKLINICFYGPLIEWSRKKLYKIIDDVMPSFTSTLIMQYEHEGMDWFIMSLWKTVFTAIKNRKLNAIDILGEIFPRLLSLYAPFYINRKEYALCLYKKLCKIFLSTNAHPFVMSTDQCSLVRDQSSRLFRGDNQRNSLLHTNKQQSTFLIISSLCKFKKLLK